MLERQTIVHGLEIVHKGQYVLMPHRYPLQDCDLISDLSQPLSASDSRRAHGSNFGLYHVLPARHHSLVDHFGGIVSTGVYVHTLLHHRVAPCAQRLPGLVSQGWIWGC